ncbi:MAG TPA: hypothetical protein VMM60_09405, partial [Ilumatobacter sp.]|nr:hypothetical protein [Ilumatobacter sp.]
HRHGWKVYPTGRLNANSVLDQRAGSVVYVERMGHAHPAPGISIDYFTAATFEVWPDLGHYPHLIEQQRFIDRVVAFDTAIA